MAKRNKKQKEPSLGFMLFTAFSGVFLGTLAAVVILLLNPVESPKVGVAGKESKQLGDYSISYAPGYSLGTESRDFKSSMTRFKRKLPGSLVFEEGEINYFLSQFKAAPAEGEEEQKSNVLMGSPNLKFGEEKMVLSSVVVINPDTSPFKLTLQTDIQFEATETGPKMIVGSSYLNCLPVPGFLSNMLIGKILGQASFPAELADSWKAVKDIRVEEKKFVVTL